MNDMNEIKIRRAEPRDSIRIAEIHIFGWRAAYRGIVSDKILFCELNVEDRINDFRQKNESSIHEIYVYEDNGIIKGFMKVGSCRNEDKKSSFELWGMYIDPLMKGNGIGTKLIKHCEQVAIERGCIENVLWVFKENLLARKFYEKNGYKTDGKEEIIDKFNATEIRYVKRL